MPRYRKRPIEVEAEQWFPGKDVPGVKFWPAMLDDGLHDGPYVTTIQEQHVNIKAGEWVIQEGDGVHAYPCDPTVFERIYDPFPDHADPHREFDAAADHPRAFAEVILDYTPTISTNGGLLAIEFDIPEQANEALDLLWAAIDSVMLAEESTL